MASTHSGTQCSLCWFHLFLMLQLKMLTRMATVKDNGTVEVQVPTDIESLTLDVGPEDTYAEFVDEEPLESTDLQYIPPLQIVILIVGTRGDVQPFVAIGKCLQVSFLSLLDIFGSIILTDRHIVLFFSQDIYNIIYNTLFTRMFSELFNQDMFQQAHNLLSGIGLVVYI